MKKNRQKPSCVLGWGLYVDGSTARLLPFSMMT